MANRTMTGMAGVRQRTHDRVDRIMDNAESMRDRGKEEVAHLRDKAVKTRENVDGYIRENPERSVLIAAGVGAVVGAVLAVAIMKRRN